MRIHPLALGLSVLAVAACAHEISSEERLDRATKDIQATKPVPPPDQLMQINCRDSDGALARARNVDRPETERVQAYIELFRELRSKSVLLEDALNREPDLTYRAGGDKLGLSRDTCVRQAADTKVEFESYIRELVNVPTVQEVKNGNTFTIPRLDFGVLRSAIEALSPEDRDTMLDRVAAVEKRLGQSPAPRRKR
ncbi:MAG: hypothetical protein ACKVPX_04395 [Myxococcaceae bacterium]